MSSNVPFGFLSYGTHPCFMDHHSSHCLSPFFILAFFLPCPWSGWEYKLYNYKICVVIEMGFLVYNLPSCALPALLFAIIYGFWIEGNLEWILKFDLESLCLQSSFFLPQSLCSLSHRFRVGTICCPDKRTQLLSSKKTWWHMTLWYTQLHMFGCPQGGHWNVWQSCTCF